MDFSDPAMSHNTTSAESTETSNSRDETKSSPTPSDETNRCASSRSDETNRCPSSSDETNRCPSSSDETNRCPSSSDETNRCPSSSKETNWCPSSGNATNRCLSLSDEMEVHVPPNSRDETVVMVVCPNSGDETKMCANRSETDSFSCNSQKLTCDDISKDKSLLDLQRRDTDIHVHVEPTENLGVKACESKSETYIGVWHPGSTAEITDSACSNVRDILPTAENDAGPVVCGSVTCDSYLHNVSDGSDAIHGSADVLSNSADVTSGSVATLSDSAYLTHDSSDTLSDSAYATHDSLNPLCDNCHVTLCDSASTDSTCTCNSADTLCDHDEDGADILHVCDNLGSVDCKTDSGSRPISDPQLHIAVDGAEPLHMFSLMPEELILKIFYYMTPQELCLYVAPVCLKWRELSREPILWQTLIIPSSMNSLHLCQITKLSPFLKTLLLHGRDQISMAEVSVLTDFCPQLEEVDVGFCDGLRHMILEFFVEKCLKLRSVNVEGCRHFNDACVKVLARAPSLERINLSHCISLTDDNLLHLSDCLNRITHLNIDGISWITDISVIALVRNHREWLTSLVLDGDQISDSSIEAIAECKNLRKLSVSYADLLTDDALGFIEELSELRYLRLKRGTDFTATGLSHLFNTDKLSKLTTLDLSECSNLSDDGVLAAVKCCGRSLHSISLCWCCDLTDQGITAIIDHCRSLLYLSLLGVCRAEGHSLDRIPEDMPYLRYLDLQQCNRINDDVIVQIIRRKQELIVLNYYGEKFLYHTSDPDPNPSDPDPNPSDPDPDPNPSDLDPNPSEPDPVECKSSDPVDL